MQFFSLSMPWKLAKYPFILRFHFLNALPTLIPRLPSPFLSNCSISLVSPPPPPFFLPVVSPSVHSPHIPKGPSEQQPLSRRHTAPEAQTLHRSVCIYLFIYVWKHLYSHQTQTMCLRTVYVKKTRRIGNHFQPVQSNILTE